MWRILRLSHDTLRLPLSNLAIYRGFTPKICTIMGRLHHIGSIYFEIHVIFS
jgi:hypothetical protein